MLLQSFLDLKSTCLGFENSGEFEFSSVISVVIYTAYY